MTAYSQQEKALVTGPLGRCLGLSRSRYLNVVRQGIDPSTS